VGWGLGPGLCCAVLCAGEFTFQAQAQTPHCFEGYHSWTCQPLISHEVGVEDGLGLGSVVSQDTTLKSRIIHISVTHVRGLPEARDNGGDLVLIHFASRGDT
jgi:hypothetical protein